MQFTFHFFPRSHCATACASGNKAVCSSRAIGNFFHCSIHTASIRKLFQHCASSHGDGTDDETVIKSDSQAVQLNYRKLAGTIRATRRKAKLRFPSSD
jgi:hypothetical protein